jgi:hypothetical protein
MESSQALVPSPTALCVVTAGSVHHESSVLTMGWRLKESSVTRPGNDNCQVCGWVVSPGQRSGPDGRQYVDNVALALLCQHTELLAVVLVVPNFPVLHPPLLCVSAALQRDHN